MIYSPVQEHMRKSILEYLDVLKSNMSAEIQQLKLRHGGLIRLLFLLLDRLHQPQPRRLSGLGKCGMK